MADRLEIPQQVVVPTTVAFIIGFSSGATTSSKLSNYQFMVENLHRLPNSNKNWYFFQKTKNYKIILAGLKGGLKLGTNLACFTTSFCVLKDLFCHIPTIDNHKTLAGGLSGLNIAIGVSLIYRLRPILSPSRLLLGGLIGSCSGLADDAKTYLKQEMYSDSSASNMEINPMELKKPIALTNVLYKSNDAIFDESE
ncbi:hypothetical protein O181_019483 [Austropuccinia psidii MF-1]|uniref:Uncharacterized protein n=1 Tax=Austropuccinia psidii MF-1 TaxID=1389203 RepID=A0A9Q3GTM6_9BASI|nr:hypothetical protein [Austropuccinia psidii MF-1]